MKSTANGQYVIEVRESATSYLSAMLIVQSLRSARRVAQKWVAQGFLGQARAEVIDNTGERVAGYRLDEDGKVREYV